MFPIKIDPKIKKLEVMVLNEEIIKCIIEQTGLNQMEINKYIQKKKKIFPGITKFGALIILSKEFCVELENLVD